MAPLIDTHAHLDEAGFDTDRDDVLSRARAAGVVSIVSIATTADSSAATLALAARYPMLRASVGIHPNHCGAALPGDWDRIIELAKDPSVVALGETGLDRHWDYTPWEIQLDYFARHLALSRELALPVVIHSRDCDAEIMETLRQDHVRGPLNGVMHSFTGCADMAAECLKLGLYISFAGMVTFKKSDSLRAVAAGISSERILVETDSPYLSPHPLRGKRNEPSHVIHTAACLAQIRGESPEAFARQTTANAQRLFAIGADD